MKTQLTRILLALSFVAVFVACGNDKKQPELSYETVDGDPLNARIYTLNNGLKVYMTVYKDAPRIQTYIAVAAGSKNDPSDATGLAHYLEHMLFKGTDKYGSLDYEKEAPLIASIDSLYEVYRQTKDAGERKRIYHIIDSVSGVAATYAIANEYDKMMSAIGAKGTNAYTWVEQTVYMNDIPSNQLETWLDIEAERFRNPVFRLFHTELEAVYEEKNISLDSDNSKLWEAMFAGLFQEHTYGTQTTIGTIEHLKNPSLKEIRKFYEKNYVPNNMAICLSGDFNPDSTIKWISEKFGQFERKAEPEFIVPVEKPITQPRAKEVWGPDAETMSIGFRSAGFSTKDAQIMEIVDKLLYNERAGLIDLNLNQKQKVIEGWSYPLVMKDYSCHLLGANPKQGQEMEEVKDLLLKQLDLIKNGEFEDWLLEAVINNMRFEQTKSFEDNGDRAHEMVNAFVLDIPWQDYVKRIEQLSTITKDDVIDFANRTYKKDNYVAVYKRTGEDKNVEKVEKPEITPVEVNREEQSEFVKYVLANEVQDIEPVFIDYNKDLLQDKLSAGTPLLYKKNEENQTFTMYYVIDMGKNHMQEIDLALQYLPYLGTSKLSPEELKQEFYKIACSYDAYSSDDQVYVKVSGLSDNYKKAVELFEQLLADAQPNEEALNNLTADILKKRADAKLSKENILWYGMYSYGIYGSQNPFTNILPKDKLTLATPEMITDLIKSLTQFEHRVLYYGSHPVEEVKAALDELHAAPTQFLALPSEKLFVERETNENMVYVINYDMKQAEILMLSKSQPYNSNLAPQISIFNEYFGGGMSSVVFQDMRESKALAYGVFSAYQTPKTKDKSHYIMAYIGTQVDKLPEAMKGMNDLLTDMPKAELSFNASKNAVLQKIRTERITKDKVLWNYEKAKKLGLDYDIRKDIFKATPATTLGTVEGFFNQNIKGRKYNIMVLGKKESLDIETLKKYGPVKFLTLEEVFGY